MSETFLSFVVVGAGVGLAAWIEHRRLSRYRAKGQCNVCGKQVATCDDCGRCLNPKCNGGCIFCREDMPFGRRLKARGSR